jgi:hypothetical protein
MSKVRKTYRLSISKRFPDGSIATLTVGTELEEECSIDEAEKVFDKARLSTREDLIKASASDPLDKSIVKSIKKQLKREKKLEEAENG